MTSPEWWADFPIDARPRPIVLTQGPVRIGRGFVDDQAALAWQKGRARSGVDVPAGVLQLIRGDRDADVATHLTITACEPLQAPFRTDRGPKPLPAYRLHITGMLDPCVVLDPTVDVWWPPRLQWELAAHQTKVARLDPDGITLHILAFGGLATEFLGARFDEHPRYVVAHALTRKTPTTGPIVAVGVEREVAGRLSAPLGNRVLLTPAGFPYTVDVATSKAAPARTTRPAASRTSDRGAAAPGSPS